MPQAVVAPAGLPVSHSPPDPSAVDGVLQLHAHPLYSVAPDLAESVRALPSWSRFPVWSINTRRGFPAGLRGFRFRAIVLHYSLFYSALEPITPEFREWLADAGASAYVIALFQDEQSYTKQRFEACGAFSVDSVYSCLRPDDANRIYGAHTSVTRVVSYHPGYVSDRLVAAAARYAKPDEQRTVDVGYRGRRSPVHWGGAAREKWEIAVEFKRRAERRGLTLDIEIDESKRIYGDAWYRFVGNCRAVLGTESGAARFDLEGEVPPAAEEMGGPGAAGEGGTYVTYRTISPRHLEAAAFRTCQILFEGEYAGVLKPMVHFIPLRKDFANFDEVLARFRDARLRRLLVENARRDLVDSGELSYRRLVGELDRELAAAGVRGQATHAEIAGQLYPPPLPRKLKEGLLAARNARFPGRARLGRWARRVRGSG